MAEPSLVKKVTTISLSSVPFSSTAHNFTVELRPSVTVSIFDSKPMVTPDIKRELVIHQDLSV